MSSVQILHEYSLSLRGRGCGAGCSRAGVFVSAAPPLHPARQMTASPAPASVQSQLVAVDVSGRAWARLAGRPRSAASQAQTDTTLFSPEISDCRISKMFLLYI